MYRVDDKVAVVAGALLLRSEEEYHRTLDTNLKSVVFGCKFAAGDYQVHDLVWRSS